MPYVALAEYGLFSVAPFYFTKVLKKIINRLDDGGLFCFFWYYIYMVKKETIKKPKLDFNGQREGEKILFVFRRHIIAMRKGFYMLVIPLIITAIPPLIWSYNFGLFLLPIGGFILGLIFFFYHFILWYFTIYIVTNQRIRQVTQRGFFGKDVIELRLSKVQNISYNICLLYTSPSPRDGLLSRMPSSA